MTVASQILLVEDDRSLRNAIAAILEREQFGVDAVRDGLAARQALAAREPRLIVTLGSLGPPG